MSGIDPQPEPPPVDQAALDEALAGRQPLDSDLTAIAALSTTAFGRGLLALADAAALRAAAETDGIYAAQGTVAVSQSGRFVPPAGGISTATAVSAGFAYWVPILLPADAYDRLGINVTIAGAGGTLARLSLYENDAVGGYGPGTLLVDAGTVAVDSTGDKLATINLTTTRLRLVWAEFVADGTPTVVGAGTTRLVPQTSMSASRAVLITTGLSAEVAGGSPATAAWNGSSNAGAGPAVFVRAAQ